jgi:sulfur carrier protein
MNLTVNGESLEMEGLSSISDLLVHLEIKAPKVAVELNLEIVPKTEFETTSLKDGDRVEVVSFVGGG